MVKLRLLASKTRLPLLSREIRDPIAIAQTTEATMSEIMQEVQSRIRELAATVTAEFEYCYPGDVLITHSTSVKWSMSIYLYRTRTTSSARPPHYAWTTISA